MRFLHNPKYTGYMVWNRRATKKGGRANPVADWVLSPEPTHPAIISPDEFAQAATIAGTRERVRGGHHPNPHPATKHRYLLRSYLVCAECDRRMHGITRHDSTYYCCRPKDGRRPEGHPVSLLVPEAPVLTALAEFISTRLLGPDRIRYLAASISACDQETAERHTSRLAVLDSEITDLRLRQDRLLDQAEDTSPADAFTAGLRRRYNDLDLQRRSHENDRHRLNETRAHPPDTDPTLLDELPLTHLSLTDLPTDIIRDLCEALTISISYDRRTRRVHCSAVLDPHTTQRLQKVLHTAEPDRERPHQDRGHVHHRTPATTGTQPNTLVITGSWAQPRPRARGSVTAYGRPEPGR